MRNKSNTTLLIICRLEKFKTHIHTNLYFLFPHCPNALDKMELLQIAISVYRFELRFNTSLLNSHSCSNTTVRQQTSIDIEKYLFLEKGNIPQPHRCISLKTKQIFFLNRICPNKNNVHEILFVYFLEQGCVFQNDPGGRKLFFIDFRRQFFLFCIIDNHLSGLWKNGKL